MVCADRLALFEAERARLFGLAYRMLGSVADAQDALQEVHLRWIKADQDQVANPQGWLTAVLTRFCLDMLKSARRKREVYFGPWLPEPLVGAAPASSDIDPDTLTTAFLLALERLTPLERAAFLLHDVFDYDYGALAKALRRGEPACRQLVARARRHVRSTQTRATCEDRRAEDLLQRFLAAIVVGDIAPLEAALTADVELWSDGGGKALAARNVIRGANHVARFLIGIARKAGARLRPVPTVVNGGPGILLFDGEVLHSVLSVSFTAEGLLSRLFLMRNPDKLAHVKVH